MIGHSCTCISWQASDFIVTDLKNLSSICHQPVDGLTCTCKYHMLRGARKYPTPQRITGNSGGGGGRSQEPEIIKGKYEVNWNFWICSWTTNFGFGRRNWTCTSVPVNGMGLVDCPAHAEIPVLPSLDHSSYKTKS